MIGIEKDGKKRGVGEGREGGQEGDGGKEVQQMKGGRCEGGWEGSR